MHTLTAIDAETGASFPIISLLAPANHHDSNFLFPLAKLGKAIGVDIKLITADEAYNDKDGDLFHDIGVHLITPPGSRTKLPNNVDPETMAVTMNDMCEIPMEYVGVFDENHEFKCGSLDGECPRRFGDCLKCREIPVDSGHFQRIPYGSDEVKKAIDIRKNGERPFNLLKHREGLEPVRVRSRQNLLARCVFTNMATLLIEMANTRKKKRIEKKIDNKQTKLALAA